MTARSGRDLAKQTRMLEIDEEFGDEWLKTMRDLLADELDDHQFTFRRMAALKEWEKRRKLAQAKLHYQYDQTRRNPDLVHRDTQRQIDKLRTEVGKLTAELGLDPLQMSD